MQTTVWDMLGMESPYPPHPDPRLSYVEFEQIIEHIKGYTITDAMMDENEGLEIKLEAPELPTCVLSVDAQGLALIFEEGNAGTR